MSTAKYQGPANFGGFTHDGVAYEPDEDGVVELPATVSAEIITAHGLKPAELVKAPKPLAKGAEGGDKGGKKTANGKPEKEEGAEGGDKGGAGK